MFSKLCEENRKTILISCADDWGTARSAGLASDVTESASNRISSSFGFPSNSQNGFQHFCVECMGDF
jgi:hypothetical protein